MYGGSPYGGSVGSMGGPGSYGPPRAAYGTTPAGQPGGETAKAEHPGFIIYLEGVSLNAGREGFIENHFISNLNKVKEGPNRKYRFENVTLLKGAPVKVILQEQGMGEKAVPFAVHYTPPSAEGETTSPTRSRTTSPSSMRATSWARSRWTARARCCSRTTWPTS